MIGVVVSLLRRVLRIILLKFALSNLHHKLIELHFLIIYSLVLAIKPSHLHDSYTIQLVKCRLIQISVLPLVTLNFLRVELPLR
jgi:hypothetical protein